MFGQTRKDPAYQGSARLSFSKFRALGSAISRVRQDTFAEKVKVRQENVTAPWGSARSALSEFLAFRKIILLNLLWGVILRFLNVLLATSRENQLAPWTSPAISTEIMAFSCNLNRNMTYASWGPAFSGTHRNPGNYHGPRNVYVNSSQGHNSCNCNCNLAAK